MTPTDTATPVLGRTAALEAYSSLDRPQRRTFAAALGGVACDGMDNAFYGLIIPSLIGVWGISRGEAGGVATLSLLMAAVGGWLGGILADRFGRVRILQISILWFSVFCLLGAFAQTLGQFTALRMLWGLGFGAEMAVSIALVGELAQARHRATLLGVMHSMFSVGAAMAALVAGLLLSAFAEDLGWRIVLAVGALPALLVLYMRRYAPETAQFTALQQSGEARPSFLSILTPKLAPKTLLGVTIAWGTLAGVAGVQSWLPTYLRTVRELSVMGTTANVILYQLSHFAGYVLGGYFADRFGRRASFVVSSLLSLASVLAYTLLPVDNFGALLLTIPLGFFTATIYGGMAALFTELFPSAIRGSGVAFCYNGGRALAASAPALIGWASQSMPLATSIGIFAGTTYGLVTLAGLLVPETKGRTL